MRGGYPIVDVRARRYEAKTKEQCEVSAQQRQKRRDCKNADPPKSKPVAFALKIWPRFFIFGYRIASRKTTEAPTAMGSARSANTTCSDKLKNGNQEISNARK